MVQHALLVEVKAVEAISLLHRQQLYTYLRLGDYRLGLLLNFGAATMKEGIARVVNGFPIAEEAEDAENESQRSRRRKIAKAPAGAVASPGTSPP